MQIDERKVICEENIIHHLEEMMSCSQGRNTIHLLEELAGLLFSTVGGAHSVIDVQQIMQGVNSSKVFIQVPMI